MYDPKTVLRQMAKRWEQSYQEALGSEVIKRHLIRLLDEAQKKELNAVFGNWPGDALLQAIDAIDELDDGDGTISMAVPSITLHSDLEPDVEYSPNDHTLIETHPDNAGIIGDAYEVAEAVEKVKRRGRPPGAPNKAPRPDKGVKRKA